MTEKLPLLPGRKVAQAFVRLGWQAARQKGSHDVELSEFLKAAE